MEFTPSVVIVAAAVVLAAIRDVLTFHQWADENRLSPIEVIERFLIGFPRRPYLVLSLKRRTVQCNFSQFVLIVVTFDFQWAG